MTDPKPAMTMREIREELGHFERGIPEPTVQPTRYVVSCLPEGHDDRSTYTVQVEYRGNDRYAVTRNLRTVDADGHWEYEPDWPETGIDEQQAWLAARLFDRDTALRLAREQARRITYRGRTVADALADLDPAAPSQPASAAPGGV